MNEEKKGKGGLIVLILALLLVCIGLGSFIFINKDKLIEKENVVDCDDKEDKTDIDDVTDLEEETTEIGDNSEDNSNEDNYTEKVYYLDGSTIVLFKSGKCLTANSQEYTPHCTYNIDNNILNLTRTTIGSNDGSQSTYVYNIIIENNEEYIVLSTDDKYKYKLLK